MKRRDCILAVTAALALLGLSAALGAEAHRAISPALARSVATTMGGSASARTTNALPFASDAWWLGFQDDTLNALVLAARHHAGSVAGATATLAVTGDLLSLPIEMQVAAAYVSTKVDSIGIALIGEAMAATRRQTELMAGGTLSDSDRSVLQQRLSDAMAAERTLVDRRAMLLALLAARCGMDTTTLEDLVAPAGTEQLLPRFNASLPEQPPTDWVFEISELQEQRTKTDALEARAAAVRQVLDDALARQQDGSGSELDVLERYQQLMLYSQQFASASGTLALGWIKLLSRLQGPIDETADRSARPPSKPLPSHGTLQRPLI